METGPSHPLPHQMILASAGSGKTHALINRYIRILLLSGKPERILALTFTRIAAGEFFHGVAERLSAAAADPAAAAALTNELNATAKCADYLRALKIFLANTHRLRLLTLDAFFARMVQCFPFELGLGGPPQILEPGELARAYRTTLDRLSVPGSLPDDALVDFWNAFKEATMGMDEKRVDALITGYVEEHHDLLLEAPAAAAWGDPAVIWPNGCPWRLERGLEADISTARQGVETAGFPPSASAALHEFIDMVEQAASPQARMPDTLKTLPGRLLDHCPQLLQGVSTTILFGRIKGGLVFADDFARVIGRLASALMWLEIGRKLQVTQGIHRIVSEFERTYHEQVRGMGKLGFADLTRLLLPASDKDPETPFSLSRMMLDYRMDGAFDHWLFDEFQDTSRPQWNVVANLVDEVVQAADGERSLFYVGDIKQSLYLWRDSDERLFFDIHDRYGSAIEQGTLACSWRSAPPVVDMINHVFADAGIMAECFGDEPVSRWLPGWETHTPAPPRQREPAQAALLTASPDTRDRWHMTLELLNAIQPLQRGLSVAVLVRKNAEANLLGDFLRSEGRMRVVTGSATRPAVDNLACHTLLALFRMAAHPADDYATGILKLSPLASAFNGGTSQPGPVRPGDADALRRQILQQVSGRGMEAAARHWGNMLEDALAATDAFSRTRLHAFYEIARRFDASGQTGIDDFVEFAAQASSQDAPDDKAVRVLTVHAAKGLGFDVVILPELQDRQTLRQARRDISVKRNPQGGVDWVLQMPKKAYAGKDSVLRQQMTATEDQAAFESLCLLYVAMTRAKRGLYLITDPLPPPDKVTATYPALLSQLFGHEASGDVEVGDVSFPAGWSAGDGQWFRDIEKPAKAQSSTPVPASPPPAAERWQPQPRLVVHRPSAAQDFRLRGSALFRGGSNEKAVFGQAVHTLFQRLRALPDPLPEIGPLIESLSADLPPEAGDAVATCLREPAFRAIFEISPDTDTLWLEKSFAVILEDRLLNGIFDRVRVRRKGTDVARVDLWDFKTDRIESASARAAAVSVHAPQIHLYQVALSRLLGIEPEQIHSYLAFTHTAEVVQVDPQSASDPYL